MILIIVISSTYNGTKCFVLTTLLYTLYYYYEIGFRFRGIRLETVSIILQPSSKDRL